jgi:DNA repair exonuclease SbcCD ATPase subunit
MTRDEERFWIQNEARRVDGLRDSLRFARKAVREEKRELKKARTRLKHSVRAQEVIVQMAQAVQQKAHQRIASVVSSCLAAVFDDPYEFKIHFEQKRGRTEARLTFLRDGLEVNPIDSSGGGAVDVAAFALRAACLVMNRPRLRRVLILDEPFKFVSEDYQPAVRSMLEQLSRDLGLQIIMVTHNKEYEIGKIIKL